MIGRADIEESKSNVAMNAWLPQASYPCGNFSDTSSYSCIYSTFKHITLSQKYFSSFPHGTYTLLILNIYLNLDKMYYLFMLKYHQT